MRSLTVRSSRAPAAKRQGGVFDVPVMVLEKKQLALTSTSLTAAEGGKVQLDVIGHKARGNDAAADGCYRGGLMPLGHLRQVTPAPAPSPAPADAGAPAATSATAAAAVDGRDALRAGLAGSRSGDILKCLVQWAGRLHSLERISGSRPSTAPIGRRGAVAAAYPPLGACDLGFLFVAGSDRLMWAMREICMRRGVSARIWRFMARAGGLQRPEHTVRESDPPELVAEQWQALKGMLAQPGTALVFHMENHYAMIYAAREWDAAVGGPASAPPAEPAAAAIESLSITAYPSLPQPAVRDEGRGSWVRQVLTSKPGQGTFLWQSFEQMRNCLTAWSGYNIMAVQRIMP